ncbi:MAG: hypothetical protein WC246_00400 [Candidatus Paceibacterota bacterium]|jgi:hypothetical protein
MNKILAMAVLMIFALPFLGGAVFAQGSIAPILPITGPQTPNELVQWIIQMVQWFYTIIFILAVFFILLSAFYFITSGGDAEKVAKAKSTLLYAVVGVAVGLLSYSIILFVQNALQSRLG